MNKIKEEQEELEYRVCLQIILNKTQTFNSHAFVICQKELHETAIITITTNA